MMVMGGLREGEIGEEIEREIVKERERHTHKERETNRESKG